MVLPLTYAVSRAKTEGLCRFSGKKRAVFRPPAKTFQGREWKTLASKPRRIGTPWDAATRPTGRPAPREQDRSAITRYISLQPCLMCNGRILLAGITRVRYLARDLPGGFAGHQLPPAWTELTARTSVRQVDVDSYWINLAEQATNQLQDRQALRERVLAAWGGHSH